MAGKTVNEGEEVRETAESQNPLWTTVKTSALADREGAPGDDGSGCC